MKLDRLETHLEGSQALRPWMLIWLALNTGLFVALALTWHEVDRQRSGLTQLDRVQRAAAQDIASLRTQLEHEIAHSERRMQALVDSVGDPTEQRELRKQTLGRELMRVSIAAGEASTQVDLARDALHKRRRATRDMEAKGVELRERLVGHRAGVRKSKLKLDRLRQFYGDFPDLERKGLELLRLQLRRQVLEAKIAAAKRNGVPVAKLAADRERYLLSLPGLRRVGRVLVADFRGLEVKVGKVFTVRRLARRVGTIFLTRKGATKGTYEFTQMFGEDLRERDVVELPRD